jgi:hypothetical protein
MEGLEIRIDFECAFHDLETVFKGDVQRPPHFFRDLAEGAGTVFDLFVEDFAASGAAAVGVEEDVPGVLHEDCAVEVWGVRSASSSEGVIYKDLGGLGMGG